MTREPGSFRKFIGATPEEYGSFICPWCGMYGIVDEDQAKGRVSIDCPNERCPFHETRILERGA